MLEEEQALFSVLEGDFSAFALLETIQIFEEEAQEVCSV